MAVKYEDSTVPVKKWLKLGIYGDAKVGKTHFILGFERPLVVIDTEQGTDWFRNRVDPFTVVKTNQIADVMEVLDDIESGKLPCATLAIDSLTIINDVVRGAAGVIAERRAVRNGKSADDATMTPRDWGLVKRKMNSLATRLYNLPCHTIISTHLKDLYEGEDDNLKRVGTRMDAEKAMAHQPDMILELAVMKGKRVAFVRGERLGIWQPDQRITDLSFETFRPYLDQTRAEGTVSRMATEEEAAQAGADALVPGGPEIRTLREVLAKKDLSETDGAVLIAAKLRRPIPSLTVLTPAEARKMTEGISGTDAGALRAAVGRLTSQEIA